MVQPWILDINITPTKSRPLWMTRTRS
jgi:hypothetical protein